jgi:hypothetical protein
VSAAEAATPLTEKELLSNRDNDQYYQWSPAEEHGNN